MNIRNILKVALRSMGRNKMRSFLTMLGIIIGVGAVIAMMAIGQGAQYNIEQQIATLGVNVLLIFPGSSNQGGCARRHGFDDVADGGRSGGH